MRILRSLVLALCAFVAVVANAAVGLVVETRTFHNSAGPRVEVNMAILGGTAVTLANKAGFERIRIYHRERIDTDFCIVVFHDGAKAKVGGSRLGLRLAAALKEFGQVHHAVWFEMD